jgi:hypothetical protein
MKKEEIKKDKEVQSKKPLKKLVKKTKEIVEPQMTQAEFIIKSRCPRA